MIINYLNTEFILEAEEEIILPNFKGAAFRGLFGNVLRRIICALKKSSCDECPLRSACVYSYIFETYPTKEPPILNREKYIKIPHPYIIEPPLEEKRLYKSGESIIFNVILIGRATEYLPYFIYTFSECGKIGIGRERGKFILKRIMVDEEEVYNSETKRIKKLNDKHIEIKENNYNKDYECTKNLKLKILTPVRIKHERKYINDLSFYVLIKSLLFRLSFLHYYHCNGEDTKFDHREVLAKAQEIKIKSQNLRWWDWERYSSRQKTRMRLGGIMGEVEYYGELGSFLPILKAGEIIHVGKNTSFGLGKYKIIIE